MSCFVVVVMGRVSLQLRIREAGIQEKKGEGKGRGAVWGGMMRGRKRKGERENNEGKDTMLNHLELLLFGLFFHFPISH